MKQGVPELNLPPAEQLQFPNVSANSGGTGSVRLDGKAWNQTISGMTDVNVKEVSMDFETGIWVLGLEYSHVRWQGNYKFFGKVMLFEIDTNGTFDINASK